MEIVFDKSFIKSLQKINDKILNSKLIKTIENVEKAENLTQIKNFKKLVGFKDYYRIKINDYRIGIEFENNNTLRFVIVCHRKNIYNKFP